MQFNANKRYTRARALPHADKELMLWCFSLQRNMKNQWKWPAEQPNLTGSLASWVGARQKACLVRTITFCPLGFAWELLIWCGKGVWILNNLRVFLSYPCALPLPADLEIMEKERRHGENTRKLKQSLEYAMIRQSSVKAREILIRTFHSFCHPQASK